MTEEQRKAFKELARARNALGILGGNLIERVLGDRRRLSLVAQDWGMTKEADIKFINRTFQESLKVLAVLFGYATPGTKK